MNPEQEAQKLLEDLGINSFPIVPRAICEQLKIHYFEEPFPTYEGTIIFKKVDEYIAMIGVNSNILEQGRKNFTCAHELGHFCMDYNTNLECSRTDIGSYRKAMKLIERRANQFSAELIFPKTLIPAEFKNGEPAWDLIKKLAELSHASLEASANRFIDITSQPCAFVVSENGRVLYARPSSAFGARFDFEDRTVSRLSMAHAAHNQNAIDDDFQVIAADVWLPSNRKTNNTEILEWSLPLNSYGKVLTILWNDSGEDFEDAEEDRHSDSDDDVSTDWEPPTFHRSKRKP
ncbi:MAG: ImmA/IrrE family metallo-endopeptidase [Bdellovibrionales bacterium]|nr:ImmA/IrrE family metallo-endopeptidase [Bdellovibrionales bacterium]